MKKIKILAAILPVMMVVLIFGTIIHAQAQVQGQIIATPTTHNVVINGETVNLRGYNIGGNNFFRLRDLAYALKDTQAQFAVSFWEEGNEVSLWPAWVRTDIPIDGGLAGLAATAAVAVPTTHVIRLINSEINLRGYNIHALFILRDTIGNKTSCVIFII